MKNCAHNKVKFLKPKRQSKRFKCFLQIIQNIAGILPENSRNSFVDIQSQKNIKKDRPKKSVFSFKADLL